MICRTASLRPAAALVLTLLSIAFFTACGGGDDPGPGAIIPTASVPGVGITVVPELPTATTVPLGTAAASPTVPASSPTRPAATATTASNNGTGDLRGFIYPISGGCLPVGDQLMPNAPRPYRNGVHEGVDFYDVDNCASIAKGTAVMAAKAGTVIRADLDYADPTPAEMQAYLNNPNTDASLDKFRGRQVWIRHDDGSVYVSRYCHLSGIAQGITVGVRVNAGQVIAYVGESGTPESLSNPGSEMHLHFEMRVGGSFLGAGQTPAQVRALYQTLFSP